MELSAFDKKYARITVSDGIYEGYCEWQSAEYCEHEYGVAEGGLQIDDWLFYETQILHAEQIPEKDEYVWAGRREHLMRLDPEPFRRMEAGRKTVELRLYDEKRQKLNVGDVIRFENTGDETEALRALVKALHRFPSFAELYRALPLTECGYAAEELRDASPRDMERYYPPEKQEQYGVVGIEVEVI